MGNWNNSYNQKKRLTNIDTSTPKGKAEYTIALMYNKKLAEIKRAKKDINNYISDTMCARAGVNIIKRKVSK